MQQLLLFSTHGAKASVLAQSVIRALPLRAVGFRMLPYDVPCTLRLGRQRTVSIPEVWEELAAPTLRRCIPRHAPILLDRLTEAALDCPAFARTLWDCFQGESPVLALADESLAPRLTALLEGMSPLALHWDGADQEALFAQLVEEITLRL